jgi:transcriptional regulator with XRE-family HTH domain
MENKKVLKELGERIKKLRKEKGWSQEILAELTGYHWKTISLLECGKLNPSFMFLWKIAEALDVSIDELFPWKKQSPSPSSQYPEISAVLTEIVRESSKEDINHLLTILKSLQKLKKK